MGSNDFSGWYNGVPVLQTGDTHEFGYWYNGVPVLQFVFGAEPILAPHIVRIAFKALGRNPYLWRTAQDFDAPREPETLAPHIVRIPFKPLGRNPYLQNTAQDFSFTAPIEGTYVPFLVRIPFKPLGQSRFLWTPPEDFSFAPLTRDFDIPVEWGGLILGTLRVEWNVRSGMVVTLPTRWNIESGALSALLSVTWKCLGVTTPLNIEWNVIPNVVPLFTQPVQKPTASVTEIP